MKTASLSVGDRSFALPPEEVERITSAAATARARGEWLEFRDAGGSRLRMLIPAEVLLVIQERETTDDFGPGDDPNDWGAFDYDV